MDSALNAVIDGERAIPLVELGTYDDAAATNPFYTCTVSSRQWFELDRQTLSASVRAMLIEVTPTKSRRQRPPPIKYVYRLTGKVDIEYQACPRTS